MKQSFWLLAALTPFAVLLPNSAYAGQLLVLGLTLGIFFGTLSLRRPSQADASTTNPGR